MLGWLPGSPHRDPLLPCSSRSSPGMLGAIRGVVIPRVHTSAAPSATGSGTSASVVPAVPAAATGAPAASGSKRAAGLLDAAAVAQGSTPPLRSAAARLGAAADTLAIGKHVRGGSSGALSSSTLRCPHSRTSGLGGRSSLGSAFCLVPRASSGHGSPDGCGWCCVSCGGLSSGLGASLYVPFVNGRQVAV